jgi:hypothetical protein
MSTFYVRKDGSGTHTTITSAYMEASAGDTIDIGEGTFTESIEVFKNNLTFVGAGKDKTIVQGNYGVLGIQTASVSSWTSGSNFFTLGGTAAIPAFIVGMSIGESGSAANSPGGAQITEIDSVNRKIYINKTFTNALTNKVMKHWGRVGTFEVRASGFTMSGMKVIDGPNGGGVAANDQGAIYLGATNANANASKLTGTHSTGFNISNCELVADGDSAIAAESNAGVGNGTVTECVFSGKTFVGQYAPSGGGNAVKQAVVFQSANLPITFTNNKLDVICGGMTNATPSVYGGNQIATIDAYGSIVTGNEFKGKAVNPDGSYFNMTGLALRMRGGNATASNNAIKGFNGFVTGGYLILPVYTNLSGKTIPVNEVVSHSGRFFKCTQAHLYAADKTPVTGASWTSYWSELTGTASEIGALLIANGKANYQANSGTNITITKALIAVSKLPQDAFISSVMGKDVLKSISKVSSDVVFSNESNWKLVSYVFKHKSSARRLVTSFRSDFNSSKKTNIKANMQVGDSFELHKVIISNPDRTTLVLKRSEISDAADFDFTLQ